MNLRRLEVACPAKVNLLLYITGRRSDGFHELVSLVAPIAYGDKLEGALVKDSSEDILTCDDDDIPVNAGNLVMKAVAAFRKRTTLPLAIRLHLTKRVPLGAGLGGGSSDAASALLILNALAPRPLSQGAMAEAAAEVGSDVPLFLGEGPVVMRGRGEVIEPVPRKVHEFLAGKRFLVFKPEFSIDTAWAYGELARDASYDEKEKADSTLRRFLDNPSHGLRGCYNAFEKVIFRKYRLYQTLQDRLEKEGFGPFTMSGSGSACFISLPESGETDQIREIVREAIGDDAFLVETQVV